MILVPLEGLGEKETSKDGELGTERSTGSWGVGVGVHQRQRGTGLGKRGLASQETNA